MRWGRLIIVLGVLAVLGWTAWELRIYGPGGATLLPGCQFRKWTGLECPGCGMTRGVAAALNGRFWEAFTWNPVGMILLPLALAGLAPEIYNWVAKRPVRWRLRLGTRVTSVVVYGIFVFWILRNTPWWPLPHG